MSVICRLRMVMLMFTARKIATCVGGFTIISHIYRELLLDD